MFTKWILNHATFDTLFYDSEFDSLKYAVYPSLNDVNLF